MNNVIIKVNNRKECKKTLNILGNLGIIWSNGEVMNSKDDKVNAYRSISIMAELFDNFGEKEEDLILCLIVEHNKLFWDFLDDMIKSNFDTEDYKVYNFKEFEKVYSL